MFFRFLSLLVLVFFTLNGDPLISDKKILICGVCRNVESRVSNTIENVENLGRCFADYRVIFYENNSTDGTSLLFKEWASQNDHVLFLSENLSPQELPPTRTEKIARARNIVLTAARDPQYADYKYLLMADLDTDHPWPIEELLKTVHSKKEWDCVAANDLYSYGDVYRDRYAFRDARFPLGPEILGDIWWEDLYKTWFKIDQEDWLSVYSAFGGFALYKTKSILPYSYSGIVTDDLGRYYTSILMKTPKDNPHRLLYRDLLFKERVRIPVHKVVALFFPNTSIERPSDYPYVTVCEHVTLHAAMAMHGHGKFFINPKMIVRFN